MKILIIISLFISQTCFGYCQTKYLCDQYGKCSNEQICDHVQDQSQNNTATGLIIPQNAQQIINNQDDEQNRFYRGQYK